MIVKITAKRQGTLQGKISDGHPSFSIRTFRDRPYNADLRN